MRWLFSTLLFSLVFTAAGYAAELDAKRIKAELIGNPILWWESDGWRTGNLLLLPDGRALLTVSNPQPVRDVGEWKIQGNEICTTWLTLRDRESKCYSIEKRADGRYSTSGGNVFELLIAGV